MKDYFSVDNSNYSKGTNSVKENVESSKKQKVIKVTLHGLTPRETHIRCILSNSMNVYISKSSLNLLKTGNKKVYRKDGEREEKEEKRSYEYTHTTV